MKGGLCIIYTSLLTISVLSSCAFFIIVVSEALQGEVDGTVDLSGLHNVSQKVKDEQSPGEIPKHEAVEEKDSFLGDHEMTFADTLSLNSVTTDG